MAGGGFKCSVPGSLGTTPGFILPHYLLAAFVPCIGVRVAHCSPSKTWTDCSRKPKALCPNGATYSTTSPPTLAHPHFTLTCGCSYRKPDSEARRAAYTTDEQGRCTAGGPHPDGDRFLPELFAASQKVLSAIRTAFKDNSLMLNDSAFVAIRL